MPGHQTRTATSGSRKSTRPRVSRSAAVRPRQRGTAQPKADAPFAASLSALKVGPRSYIEVVLTLKGKSDANRKMLADLTASYMAAERAWNGIKALPAHLKDTTNVPKAIAAVTRQFSDRFCKGGVDYIVHENHSGHYHFVLYRYCKWHALWHIMEVRNLLYTASRISKTLEKLCYSFVKLLEDRTSIGTWYNGALEYAEDWLSERVGEGFVDMNDKDLDPEMSECLTNYRTGTAAQVATRIRDAEVMTPNEMIKRLARIRKKHNLIESLILMCELLNEPYSLGYFDNTECDDEIDTENGIDALSFWEQHTVVWDYEDQMTTMWKEWLDCRYNESGISGPFATFHVHPKCTDWSREQFDNSVSWPQKFSDLVRRIDDSCVRPEKNANEGLLINILT